jgi:hypothetical protein
MSSFEEVCGNSSGEKSGCDVEWPQLHLNLKLHT